MIRKLSICVPLCLFILYGVGYCIEMPYNSLCSIRGWGKIDVVEYRPGSSKTHYVGTSEMLRVNGTVKHSFEAVADTGGIFRLTVYVRPDLVATYFYFVSPSFFNVSCYRYPGVIALDDYNFDGTKKIGDKDYYLFSVKYPMVLSEMLFTADDNLDLAGQTIVISYSNGTSLSIDILYDVINGEYQEEQTDDFSEKDDCDDDAKSLAKYAYSHGCLPQTPIPLEKLCGVQGIGNHASVSFQSTSMLKDVSRSNPREFLEYLSSTNAKDFGYSFVGLAAMRRSNTTARIDFDLKQEAHSLPFQMSVYMRPDTDSVSYDIERTVDEQELPAKCLFTTPFFDPSDYKYIGEFRMQTDAPRYHTFCYFDTDNSTILSYLFFTRGRNSVFGGEIYNAAFDQDPDKQVSVAVFYAVVKDFDHEMTDSIFSSTRCPLARDIAPWAITTICPLPPPSSSSLPPAPSRSSSFSSSVVPQMIVVVVSVLVSSLLISLQL